MWTLESVLPAQGANALYAGVKRHLALYLFFMILPSVALAGKGKVVQLDDEAGLGDATIVVRVVKRGLNLVHASSVCTSVEIVKSRADGSFTTRQSLAWKPSVGSSLALAYKVGYHLEALSSEGQRIYMAANSPDPTKRIEDRWPP